ncbi:N-formylglutamate amidohydrolase [Orrella sp. 11846]|uniref:N-formylglutamate amidohydrolase n=1 Tax=Orrella sp. 11846 TaxID=3409913 RepID=UPI003B5B8328
MTLSAQNNLPPVIRHEPKVPAIALVCDSPHSGITYPDGFQCAAPQNLMRMGEDNHIHTLWKAAPDVGATLIEATFPRVFIDPNRSLKDLDPDMMDGQWPEPLSPGEKTRLGKGLIWARLTGGVPIYDRKLPVAEVQDRIETYYKPYHAALSDAIDQHYKQFNALWHLNLHSMPHNAYEGMGIKTDKQIADFVLGDRDGTTCSPEFVDVIATFLRSKGYSVACNDPYKGVELIAQIGQPERNRHSLQIEILRPLYMNEDTREPNEGFTELQNNLTTLLNVIRDYIVDQTK